ncbi:GH12834 [Drosophila grimshawi]|uniref:GH12834 n=1 Tax=Drosophila grimshawi TaxID=7222 RepID=B4JLD0_DROGR|nr:GH12834 [Drosophila grimshawi]
MNSDQIMQMPSGPPPASQRATCGEFSGDRESYGATGNLGYGGIPTTSTSSYGSFGVLSSISTGVTGTPALPLLLPVPPLTSTFKTSTITMPTSTSPSPLIPMSTPTPSPLLAIPMTTPTPIPTPNPIATAAPPATSLLPMSMATTTPMPTQLLPMPTLEDIEVATQRQPPSVAPPQQQQQPAGILKYPTASTIGYISELLPPPAPLLGTSASSSINSNCGTLKSNAKLLPLQLVGTTTSSRHGKDPPGSVGSGAQSQQRQRRQGWCACFGSGPNASEAKTPPGFANKSKKRKQTAQTVWSALLTNLGICMLLLAYTLLGKCSKFKTH